MLENLFNRYNTCVKLFQTGIVPISKHSHLLPRIAYIVQKLYALIIQSRLSIFTCYALHYMLKSAVLKEITILLNFSIYVNSINVYKYNLFGYLQEIHLKSHFAPVYCIAGPKKHTIQDFWQMVWQEKVDIIVMVTNLEEERRVT